VLEKSPNCGNYGTFHKFVDLWDIAYAYRPWKTNKHLKKNSSTQLKIITSFPKKIKWIKTKRKKQNPPTGGGRGTLCFFLSTIGPSSLTQCSNWIARQSLRRRTTRCIATWLLHFAHKTTTTTTTPSHWHLASKEWVVETFSFDNRLELLFHSSKWN